MPKGPKGVRRPADTNAAAVMVGRIAVGEIEDKPSKAPGRAYPVHTARIDLSAPRRGPSSPRLREGLGTVPLRRRAGRPLERPLSGEPWKAAIVWGLPMTRVHNGPKR
jgi:hypothetical protein